ncbi:redox-sensing transcriptional repressor Rex, partial [Candidatus Bipolaricaulota bacterium]|nr:redox-sensing transcriptional repressor Rex [Candidatus Bipolaricaulota bacterium]
MKKRKEIPKETLKRLPLYLRCLNELILKGQTTLSSKDLATILPMNSAKIRKDLSYFGNFGKRGVGYELKSLIVNIREILNLDQTWRLALVGVGDIGSALLSYPGFNQGCFQIELAFDDDPDLIGSRVAGKKIRDSKDITPLVKEFETQIGIIAVPAETARDIADRLI